MKTLYYRHGLKSSNRVEYCWIAVGPACQSVGTDKDGSAVPTLEYITGWAKNHTQMIGKESITNWASRDAALFLFFALLF
jgi:hypothetical protein